MEQAGKGANAFHQAHTIPETGAQTPESARPHQSRVFKMEQTPQKCMSCGKNTHARRDCKFYNAICRICNKRGHISDICMSSINRKKSTPSKTKPTHCVEQEISEGEEDEIQCLHIFKCDTTSPPILVQVNIEGSPVSMELDTGSSVSIIPRNVYESTCKHLELKPAKVKLRTYGNEIIVPMGVVNANISYNDQCCEAKMYVVDGPRVALFGRSWLRLFKLDWPSIKLVQGKNTALSDLTEKYQDVFSDELGCLKGYAAQLHVRDGATPVHQKHRTVPFAIRHQVETELENLEKQGIISPIPNSEWATPVVPVVKKSGGIRLCGDFKVTLNPELVADSYPLPTLDDLQEKMNGGSFFSKLDLTKAYSQIPLDDSAKQFTTLTTHKGLYAYNRLPFGVASSAAIFQRQMDRIFKDLPQVLCYQDDILVTGRDSEEHLTNLEEVLRRLHANGLTAQREKCEFMQPSLKYLGHVIDKDGIHPTSDKVEAIKTAPSPQDVTQLRAFLGLVNYYQKFLPNLSQVLQPLHQLLKKDTKWYWSAECQKAFTSVKSMITVDNVLVPYNPDLPIILDCDASAYGLGAVLSHQIPDGTERPIAFASRTMNSSEKNYAQIDKEALSIVFGVTRFHIYLYGRNFTLRTDHQPLMAILGPKRGIPPIAAMRMQRWATKLSAYSYDIQYRSSNDHSNADALSRLPQHKAPKDGYFDLADLYQVEQMDRLPVTADDIREHTAADPLLHEVHDYVLNGFPRTTPSNNMKPFLTCAPELSLHEGCVMRGHRVVIPSALRARTLDELHESHLGIVKMKELARGHIWWPGIDKDIEDLAKSCGPCNTTRNAPPSQYHPWAYPQAPWERIHIDFAGPVDGIHFLVVVDAYSKWLEIVPMRTTTAPATIKVLHDLFARFGLPIHVVSDNGSQFTSEAFDKFMKQNGVKHTTTAPYHPKSNGQAERFVQTFKLAYEAGQGPPSQIIADFLLKQRNTSNATTQQTPAKLMLGRNLRTRLDLLSPYRPASPKTAPALSQPSRCFTIGHKVWYRDFSVSGGKWSPGCVTTKIGNVMYEVQPDKFPQQHVRRHADQLCERTAPPYQDSMSHRDHQLLPMTTPAAEPLSCTEEDGDATETLNPPQTTRQQNPPTISEEVPEDAGEPDMPRRSSRANKGIAPDRLNL
ncbi:uncharacterized protein K02A2.6 [Nematostella vectensis]|uniref:uncharacterized protein K02A2.6 n=1 Tax=Nematostella vectensis TaxID=45351 RepID=UPI002077785C|nr:uncharacterized protein K02A2.6 [Nematostella vectensis]